MKLKALVDNWATRMVSYAGRFQLFRSAVGGVFSFWFTGALLLTTVIDRIEGVCWRFLWGGNNRVRRCSVVWDAITLPRAEGGLCIKEALAWNKAIFFKLIFDIGTNRPCIWSRWVVVSYGRRGDFWTTVALNDDSCT